MGTAVVVVGVAVIGVALVGKALVVGVSASPSGPPAGVAEVGEVTSLWLIVLRLDSDIFSFPSVLA